MGNRDRPGRPGHRPTPDHGHRVYIHGQHPQDQRAGLLRRGTGTTPAIGLTTPVDFSGKRVAVVGTGSSGVQSIPVIASQAKHVTVFQRTPQYTVPARHGSIDKRFIEEEVKPNYDEIIEKRNGPTAAHLKPRWPGRRLTLRRRSAGRYSNRSGVWAGTTSSTAPSKTS